MNRHTTILTLTTAAIALTLIFAAHAIVTRWNRLTTPLQSAPRLNFRATPTPQPPQPDPTEIRRDLVPRRPTRQRISIHAPDQSRAEAEAEYMAQHQIHDHVGTTIGDFEGVGWSNHGTIPPTCEPGSPCDLTADAIATGTDGNYRVRAWRRF